MTLQRHQNQEPEKKDALIKFALLGMLLLAVLAGASWYQQTLAPQDGTVRHDCDLQQGLCYIELNNSRLELEAGPLPIRSLSQLNLTLNLEGLDARRIWADLQGADMYMGVNQFEFQRDSALRWRGHTELAVCVTGRMTWQLTLKIETPAGLQQHLFEFEAQ
ncbi:hypothetical protein [Marinobacterium sediminicola]|uniref:Uncharacterized protein n=1 Tax=Marinobacterium sediminicola TaxID=518898 RepID=A0ABY1RYW8_9GAMM|nr:hypothetical protein [Marinobacterium sediminicola]ULG67980.1 hypothetical protein LN244_09690 [Marinobacterium sediminicola]SMR73512.1 hypothetical protein SAMN04487964_104175 [Marinobacterium sediminicola]